MLTLKLSFILHLTLFCIYKVDQTYGNFLSLEPYL